MKAGLIPKSARMPADRLLSAASAAVHSLDRDLPVFDVATMEERLGVSIAPQRANMTLMSVFAALAVLWRPSASLP